MLNQRLKFLVKAMFWFFALVLISIFFISNAYVTPQGIVGVIKSINVLTSSFFLCCWFTVSYLAGYKKITHLFVGCLLYSLLPILFFVGINMPGGTYLYLLGWASTLPLQGFFFNNTTIGLIFLIQLILLFCGYYIGNRKANIEKNSDS